MHAPTKTLETKEKQNILLVDDRLENLLALEAILEAPHLNIIRARSGNEALEQLLAFEFALVLLDVQMPEMDGFETARLMRSVERSRHIPIIFVTAISKEDIHVFKGYEAGAVDYIMKPLDPVILTSKVNIFLTLDAQHRELEKTTKSLRETIAQQEEYKKVIEKQNIALKELSIRDGLTGIYNHRHFQELLAREVALANRHDTELCCLMMDLDYFKVVNDTLGHPFGDFVLKQFVTLVKEEIRSSDILARYGGEEFIILLPNISLNDANKVAEKIRTKVETHTYKDGIRSSNVTVSIGLYCNRYHSSENGSENGSEDLLRFADKALYQAKELGRNRVVVYGPESPDEPLVCPE
ncbi:MAG: diguanylate cyclase [Desulfobulbaceae bacterium]|nr:diguanylate cyclase [Desulfobulbaceae bacterium]